MRRFLPYFKYLRPVRGAVVGAILAGLIYGAANGAGLPLMIKWVFPKIFSETAQTLTTLQLVLVALWLPAVFAVRGAAGFLNSYLIQWAGLRVLEAIRLDFFRKLQSLPLAFIHRHSSGDLISRGLNDASQLQVTLTNISNDGLKQPATLIGAFSVLVWLAFNESGVVLVLVTLAIVPLSVFPIRFVGKRLIKRAHRVQHQLGSVSDRFVENLSAAREVRAFGLESKEVERLSAETRQLVKFQMKTVKYDQSLSPSIELISAIGISVTLIYAYRSQISLTAFISVITALYTCYEPIKKLGALNSTIKRGTTSLERIEVVLNAPPEIADPANPVPVDRLAGSIAFNDVSFAYQPGQPVLHDVSITIPAGTVCALVGPSGAGKSTFANLVPRFYEVAAGSVAIDGIDVRSMKLADLRRNQALVSQDTVLFNDTIYNNLLLGRPDATRAEVEQAARDAFAHDFITAFPEGYETIVGERGARLSGGQKQRIALARAFLRNAPLLILDEATSALDSESEEKIQRALKKLIVGKTVLTIAHRFSTIRDATLILVFHQGRIVASGSHAELYAGNDLYRSLYDQQAAKSSAS